MTKYSTSRSPPNIPEVKISEDLAVNVALALRTDINQALHLLREISLGHDLMKFLGVYPYLQNQIWFDPHWQVTTSFSLSKLTLLTFQVIVALWILSEIGSLCDFLTLFYVGNDSFSSLNSLDLIL